MEIVLGVSMTPTTVRLVLVEGERADGATVDHDVFDIAAAAGSATSSASNQVIDAIMGTRESAVSGGHCLRATGVTWSDHAEAAAMRDALMARGVEDVVLVSELHAAGALAQAVGRAVGYQTTALMFIERDSATLAVVQTGDGSNMKVVGRNLRNADAMAALTDMVRNLETREPRPEALFLVGSGVDVASAKSHLEDSVSIPLSAPKEPEFALARGAALVAANTPLFDASTVGLAYSRAPGDATTAEKAYPARAGLDNAGQGGKPFMLAGSSLSAIFAVGVLALVVSLALSIQPIANQRRSAGTRLAVQPPTAENARPFNPRPTPNAVPAPALPSSAQIGPPLMALQKTPPVTAMQKVLPPPAVLPRAPIPAAPGPVGPPPASFPAPLIQFRVGPPWYPVPPPWHGHHGRGHGD